LALPPGSVKANAASVHPWPQEGRQKPLVLLWFAANHQRRKPEHRGEHRE